MINDTISDEELEMQNGESSINCTISDVNYCLEDEGYGVVIIPKGEAFFCFSSDDKEAINKASLRLLKELNELGIKHDCYVKG
jgi:hypothetical protein